MLSCIDKQFTISRKSYKQTNPIHALELTDMVAHAVPVYPSQPEPDPWTSWELDNNMSSVAVQKRPQARSTAINHDGRRHHLILKAIGYYIIKKPFLGHLTTDLELIRYLRNLKTGSTVTKYYDYESHFC